MEFHKETIEGLKAKEYTVGRLYAAEDGHQFISVNGLHMPIEWARDMNLGRVTLAEIETHMARPS
jgi:hypothetical protein